MAIIISEMNNYLANKKFKSLNVVGLLIISLAVYLTFPEGRRGLFTPQTPTVMIKTMIILIAPINLHFLNRGVLSSGIQSAERLHQKKDYSYIEIYLGKIFVNLFLNFLLLFSALPIMLLVSSIGGFTFSAIGQYYYKMIFASLAFGWLGLVLSGIERLLLRNLIAFYLSISYMFMIINMSYQKYNRIFITIIIFSVLIFLWKMSNIFWITREREEGEKKDGI